MAGRIQIYIRMSGSSKNLIIDKACLISELFGKVQKDILGETANTASFYLICDGEQLEENTGGTIESFGIAHGSILDFCQRLRGGSVHGSLLDFCQRLRGGSGRLTALPGKISLTKEPCCLTYDDDPSTDRAKMPCRCSISVEAMKDYCDTELEKGRYKFPCPNCRADWPFYLIGHVLSSILSTDQLSKLSMKINDNFFGNRSKVKRCPSCSNYSERSDQTNNRVLCAVCTTRTRKSYEFCWACLNPWKKAGLSTDCGNTGCTGKDSRLRYLEECPTKIIGRVSGVPSVRVCQNCGNFINHTDACKHMTCKCGYNFCFVCLQPQINDQWQCGSYGAVCPVAPRQTSIP